MVHALLEVARTRFKSIWTDDESIECLAEAEKDARQSISSAMTQVNPATAPVYTPSAPSIAASWVNPLGGRPEKDSNVGAM